MAGCGDEVDAGLLPRGGGGLDLDLRLDDALVCGPDGLEVLYDSTTVQRSPTGVLSAVRERRGAEVAYTSVSGVAASTELVLTYDPAGVLFDSGDGMWDGTYLKPPNPAGPVAIESRVVLATPFTGTILTVFRWRGLPSLFPIVNWPVRSWAGAYGGNTIVGASWVGYMFAGTRLQVVLYSLSAIPTVVGGRASIMKIGG